MKTLVTGATGFVGREIVAELVASRIETARIGRRKYDFDTFADCAETDYFQADIAVAESLRAVGQLEKLTALVHCAGLAHQFGKIDRREFYKNNILGTENILHLAVKLKAEHFILISSTAVYGIPQKKRSDGRSADAVITEADECRPATPYAESKLAAERTALDICRKNGISLTILRLSPVLGEGGTGNVERLIEAVDNRRFAWVGDGKNLKSLIYKKDAARACVDILKNKKAVTEIFNVAAEPIAMSELVGCIALVLGRKVPRINIPANVLELAFDANRRFVGINKIEKLAATLKKWLSDDVYSAEKIKRAYGFEPRTSVPEAVKKQIAYYKNEIKIK